MTSTNNKFIALKIASWNANSLYFKLEELKLFMYDQDIDIMCICETHLNKNQKCNIANYKQYRCDRTAYRGGGTSIYVKNSYSTTFYNKSNDNNQEEISIMLNLSNRRKIKITSFYNPPNNEINEDTLNRLFPTGLETIVIGDLNAKHKDWGCKTTNNTGRRLKPIIMKLNLNLLAPKDPTHYTNAYGSDILDIMITNSSAPFSIEAINYLSSDHLPILVNTCLNKNDKIKKRTKTDWLLYENLLNLTQNTEVPQNKSDVDNAIRTITKNITNAYQEATEEFTVRADYKAIPKHIRNQIKMKNKLRKEYQKTLNPLIKQQVNNWQKDINNQLRAHNQENWNNKIENLSMEDNSVWTMVRALKADRTNNMPLNTKNGKVYTDEEKVKTFAETIEQQFLLNSEPKDPQSDYTIISTNQEYFRNKEFPNTFQKVTTADIINIIKKLANRKAPGQDCISNVMIKHAPMKIIDQLKDIFNACLEIAYFPDIWKLAIVILFPKPHKNHLDPGNYRPISLLTTFSKILEKIIYKQLLPYLDFLPSEQFGFRNNLSTTKQLIRIIEYVSQGIYKKEYTAILMLDIAKAFDKVWHEGLLYKLITNNIPKDFILLLKSYLAERTFQIKINHSLSNIKEIKAGVPQGSILGPILFLIYCYDFPINKTNRNSCTAFYADDTAILNRSLNPNKALKNIQNDIPEIETWCKTWKVKINATKSNLLLIKPKKHKHKLKTDTKIVLFNEEIPIKDEAKYLGVTLNKNLKWNKHITDVINKAKRAFHALKPIMSNKSKLMLKAKRNLYIQCIRPIISYASPAWATMNITQKRKLQTFQNKTLRHITGAPWFISNEIIRRDLKIEDILEHLSKLSVSFYKEATKCTTCNYNNIFDFELVENNFSPITSFFMSDGILSSRFR